MPQQKSQASSFQAILDSDKNTEGAPLDFADTMRTDFKHSFHRTKHLLLLSCVFLGEGQHLRPLTYIQAVLITRRVQLTCGFSQERVDQSHVEVEFGEVTERQPAHVLYLCYGSFLPSLLCLERASRGY